MVFVGLSWTDSILVGVPVFMVKTPIMEVGGGAQSPFHCLGRVVDFQSLFAF
jgi:hypothetical protein